MRKLLEPWIDPGEHAEGLHEELRRELSWSHPLKGRSATVIGRSTDSDDILLDLGDGTFAVVHLTWSQRKERAPWPMTTTFESFEAFERDVMLPQHREFLDYLAE